MRLAKPILVLFLAALTACCAFGGKGNQNGPAEFDFFPMPVGGMQALQDNVEYPKKARKEQIEGTVLVSALIKADGTVTDLEIVEGIQETLDEAALRAVRMTEWQPAQKDGLPIDLKITIPIQFKLEAKKEDQKK
jgi:protein TonB